MIDFYINTIDLFSDNFKIRSEEVYNTIVARLEELSEQQGLYFKLNKANHKEYYIKLTLNPQEYYNQSACKYNTNVDHSKFIKALTKLQSEIQSIELEKFRIKIRPIEEWEVKLIEFSKDIELDHEFFNYIETIKSINPKREGKYSIVGTYENDTCIYFNTKPKDNSRNYNTHIRFENKVKMAKTLAPKDEDLHAAKENLLKCTIMLKKHYVTVYQRGLTTSYSNFYNCLMGYSDDYDKCRIKVADIIQDFQSDLSRCREYFTDTLGKNLFTEEFTAIKKFKNDEALLDSIIKNNHKNSEKQILLFIIIKLLSKLKGYNFAPVEDFLKRYKNKGIKNKRIETLAKIKEYRRNYSKNYKSYSTKDLYQDIKRELLET